MKKIRKNTFETNSSSTHSLAVPTKRLNRSELPSHIDFHLGEFGWDFVEVNAADYFYTWLFNHYKNNKVLLSEKINKLDSILHEYGITATYETEHEFTDRFLNESWTRIDTGYIDHTEDLEEHFEKMLEHKAALIKFLCMGRVFTGTDNCNDKESAMVYRDSPTYEEHSYNGKDWIYRKKKNPYYLKGYDWFFKGN